MLFRNQVQNTAMEKPGAAVAVRQNLAKYTNFEAQGTVINVRQNLAGNPRGVYALPQYSSAGAQVITANVPVTGHPEGITTANRFTYGGVTPNNPGVQFFNGTPGTNYTMSAWIFIESLCDVPGTTGFAESGVLSGANFANTVGVWQKVTWNRTPTSGNGIGIRTAAADGGSASILITGIMIEAVPQAVASPNFFDGNTAPQQNLIKSLPTAPNGAVLTHDVMVQGSLWKQMATNPGTSDRIVRQSVLFADMGAGGKVYTVAVTLYNPQTVSQWVRVDWCDVNTQSYLLAPGETRRVKITEARSAYDTNYRFADISMTEIAGETRFIYFKDWIIEEGTTNGDYYAGMGDFTYTWSGTPNASISNQRAIENAGWTQISTSIEYSTVIQPFQTTRSAAVITKGATGDGITASDCTVGAGTKYTMSIWVKLTSVLPQFNMVMRWKDSSFAIISDDVVNVYPTLVIGQYVRVSMTATAPAGAVSMQPIFRVLAAHTATVFYVDGLLIEASPFLGPYFDGSTPASGDFTYAWTGAVNASTSEQRAPSVSGMSGYYSGGRLAWQSGDWAASGTKSLAVAGGRPTVDSFSNFYTLPALGNLSRKTFTFLATLKTMETFPVGADGRAWSINLSVNLAGGGTAQYNFKPTTTHAGVHNVRAVVTFPADATTLNYMRLYNGSPNDVNVYWDNLAIVEGEMDGPAFSGDDMDTGKFIYAWDGTPHASSSTRMDRVDLIHWWTRFWYGFLPSAYRDIDAQIQPENGSYPLLRFMDGPGQVAGQIRDLSDLMRSGSFMDPATTPDAAVKWLAQLLGVNFKQRNIATAELRAYLLDIVASGRPAVGTTQSIVDAAKRFLVGDRQVTVVPSTQAAHTILVLARNDEVPNGDLDALVAGIRSTGVVPAGHNLVAQFANATWDAYEAAAGATWDVADARQPTWREADSLGITLQ